jgi:hypothetical protein
MAGPVTTRRVSVAAMLAVLTVAAFMLITRGFSADATSSLPADKMTTSAASWSVQGPNTTVPVLTAQMRTSNPADLILHLTSECSILSSITNMGTSDTQMFQSTVQFYITIDGKTIPVVPGATGSGASSGSQGDDDGTVTFCDREFKRTTTFDTSNESIKDEETTSSATAFNWAATNVGSGVHKIVVYAKFTDTNSADATSHGVVGRRSLNVDVTNYAISQPTPAPAP